MSDASAASSGKSHRDENFPVATLLAARNRAPVLAFYHFVRAADDVADHPTLPGPEKLRQLDAMALALQGEGAADGTADRIAAPLRRTLAERRLSSRHALDLIDAFRLDVTKNRYENFDDLIAYCRLSAMPVGRYVLDLHGEDDATWPANDALCAALQIINHLQDCGKDYRDLNRVYLPRDTLARAGARVEMLAENKAAAPLRAAIVELACRTQELLKQSAAFAGQIRDLRLAMNVAAIQRLAEDLTQGLLTRDPLSEDTHASKARFAWLAARGAGGALLRRFGVGGSARA